MRAALVATLLGCAAARRLRRERRSRARERRHRGRGRAPGAEAAQPPAAAGARDPWTHLQALAAIGTRNRGTRAAATPGGVATEDLIAARLRAAGFAVRFESVRFPFFDERRPPLVTLPGGRSLAPSRDVRTLAYSAAGDVRAPVRVVGGGRADAGCRTATGAASRAGRSRSCAAASARSPRRPARDSAPAPPRC